MLAASLNRDEFLLWIGQGSKPAVRRYDRTRLDSLGRNQVLLLWRDSEALFGADSSNPIIVVKDQREFFAFVSTYVSTYRPFSAFFRVISQEIVANMQMSGDGAPLNVLEPWFIGVLIAEARAQVGQSASSFSDISVQSCLATASSPIAYAITKGLDIRQVEAVFESWHFARLRLLDEKLNLSPASVWGFWQIVISALYSRTIPPDRSISAVSEFVRSVAQGASGLNDPFWSKLPLDLNKTKAALSRMSSSREDRVRALDDAMNELRGAALDQRMKEMIAGFLASQVSDGSMRYFDLISQGNDGMPGTQLWYGLFCGLSKSSDVLSIGDSLGRHLQKMEGVSQDIFQKPSGDIALAELEVVSSEFHADPKIRLENIGTIRVEVYPGIVAYYRRPRNWKRIEPDARTQSLPDEALLEARNLVRRLEQLLSRLGGEKQANLFEPKPASGLGRRIRKSK